jgi:hypothetical protein
MSDVGTNKLTCSLEQCPLSYFLIVKLSLNTLIILTNVDDISKGKFLIVKFQSRLIRIYKRAE